MLKNIRERHRGWPTRQVGPNVWRWAPLSIFLLTSCSAPEETANTSGSPGETADEVSTSTGSVASIEEYPRDDNPLAGCAICHIDVEDEVAGTRHLQNNIGCKTCHGPSEGHLADENNEVKPDRLFTRENVDGLCALCHQCGRPSSNETVVDADGLPTVCTGCHGHHDQTLKTAAPGQSGGRMPNSN